MKVAAIFPLAASCRLPKTEMAARYGVTQALISLILKGAYRA